jgi:hypothetical protein
MGPGPGSAEAVRSCEMRDKSERKIAKRMLIQGPSSSIEQLPAVGDSRVRLVLSTSNRKKRGFPHRVRSIASRFAERCSQSPLPTLGDIYPCDAGRHHFLGGRFVGERPSASGSSASGSSVTVAKPDHPLGNQGPARKSQPARSPSGQAETRKVLRGMSLGYRLCRIFGRRVSRRGFLPIVR